jgi:uncharacterized protein YndB with AHSA1/START domain
VNTDAVTVTAVVAVDPATAFRIFTEETDSWWRHGPRFRPALHRGGIMRFEPGPGGRLVEVYGEAGGDEHELGRVTVWVPGQRLVFELGARTFTEGQTTEVEVRFEPVALSTGEDLAGTRVTVVQRGWDSIPPDHPARHGQGSEAFHASMGLWWGDLVVALGAHVRRRAA